MIVTDEVKVTAGKSEAKTMVPFELSAKVIVPPPAELTSAKHARNEPAPESLLFATVQAVAA